MTPILIQSPQYKDTPVDIAIDIHTINQHIIDDTPIAIAIPDDLYLFTPHDIDLPNTMMQSVIQKVCKVAKSCKTDEHRAVLDNMMDNLYNLYGYEVWDHTRCLITRE